MNTEERFQTSIRIVDGFEPTLAQYSLVPIANASILIDHRRGTLGSAHTKLPLYFSFV